ncbi:hypothetical protein LQ327_07590 [Actinomycetospora endophytica]|uniref:Uncharacterized protein n=1 Tax=Actinomycetospora endophytica TaxID=2291215 RepID=A0ABS8P4R4_9PSEU|nr:hypothetical protein [Actinomycetospora endophytica]MCD2193247.1 hypothetical protein [Actinomycetospora endophytica]
MGRHHVADTADTADAEAPQVVALRSTPFPAVVPGPRVSPEAVPAATPAVVSPPRGWRARRVARAEAAVARAHAMQIAHAERRARQVALASRVQAR